MLRTAQRHHCPLGEECISAFHKSMARRSPWTAGETGARFSLLSAEIKLSPGVEVDIADTDSCKVGRTLVEIVAGMRRKQCGTAHEATILS
jgi:hypothetical protein